MTSSPKVGRGSIIIEALVLTTILAFLASLTARVLFSHAQVYGETQGRVRAQKAAEAANFELNSCLESVWNGSTATFSAAFDGCKPASVNFGGRVYALAVTKSGDGIDEPFGIVISVKDAF